VLSCGPAMSDLTASSTTQAPAINDPYDELLASVRARFKDLSQGPAGKPSLFTTKTPALFQVFLDAVPAELRQSKTCSACRKFVERYGGVVLVDPAGNSVPVLWDPESTPEPYTAAIRALASAVSRAPIDGVFLSDKNVWGTPQTGTWEHLAVTPAEGIVYKPSAVKTTAQVIAGKRHDHETLLRGLEDFPLEIVKQAHTLLTTEALYRSEACIGVAKWLLDLHEQRRSARNLPARASLTWLAVARAPAGFCHVRSSMIGTLLEDLAAGLPFAQIKTRFDAKMHPLQYQRPTAAPSAGNIAQAEKIVATLKTAGALERRFARLDDLQTLWIPKAPARAPEKKGVFGHLKTSAPSAAEVDVPPVTMTWDKFSRTVLPAAESIEFFVPTTSASYLGLVTAKHPEAPPIIQWDFEDRRNPVTWYMYVNGSAPTRWNLKPGVYHPVTAIALQPSMWHPTKSFAHQGAKVLFILKDAKDREYSQGAGFFPEFLKSEYHEIRATMEAYAKSAVLEGKDEAEACGIGLQKGATWNHSFRVTSKGGVRVVYKLDRWD
jgi:hypothetical protein